MQAYPDLDQAQQWARDLITLVGRVEPASPGPHTTVTDAIAVALGEVAPESLTLALAQAASLFADELAQAVGRGSEDVLTQLIAVHKSQRPRANQ